MKPTAQAERTAPSDSEDGLQMADRVRSLLTALVLGGVFLVVFEIVWTAATGRVDVVELSVPAYIGGVAATTLGLWMVHALPVWGIYELGRRFVDRSHLVLVVLAAAYGLSWQQTLVQGDGIGAHPYFALIRIAFLVLVPLACAVAVWFLTSPAVDLFYRRVVAVIGLVIGVGLNAVVLTDYQPFHGHLAAFNAAIFVGLVRPLWRRSVARKVAVACVVCAVVVTAVLIPQQEEVRTNIQRFSHVSAVLSSAFPVGWALRVEPEKIFTVEKASHDELREFHDVFFEDTDKFDDGEQRGENILFVVLESVRADYWDDPELTPEFHDWKREGVYFPYSVANYPATPLAYGAMFAAQPPSVLAQTPYWGRHRLFDGIADDFDELYFSRPDISWFEHTAITDFFLPDDAPIHDHETGPAGLENLRENLEGLHEGDSFFSWVHLYEPHSPYEAREPWADGDTDDRSAYRSEIAYTDHHLGEFMKWFFDQPFADDTLVIVISDHGQGMGEEIMGEPFWGHHVHVHNAVTEIPVFVAGPGFESGERRADIRAMQLDTMPTIYDFLGQALPRDLMPQGNSMYRLVDDRPPRPLVTEAFSIRGHQFFDFVADAQQGDDVEELRREFHRISTDGHGYSPKISIRYGDHKLIYDRLLETAWLYDVVEDPEETRDLYDERPQKAQQMYDRLEQWNTLQGEVVRRLDEVLLE